MCHNNNSRIFALPELVCQSQDIKQKAHFEENLNIFKVYKLEIQISFGRMSPSSGILHAYTDNILRSQLKKQGMLFHFR